MNKIRFLLCFALLVSGVEARGQIYIDSYRFGGGADNLLLDSIADAQLALSFRKLDKDYTGNCIVVRRSSDNTLDTIGFSGNYLDTARLKTFCASTSCFLRLWYDQSGNNRNFGQDTTTLQPRIVNNGVLEKSENEVALYGDGIDDEIFFSNKSWANFMHNGTANSYYWVGQVSDLSNPNTFYQLMGNNISSGDAVGIALNYEDRSSLGRNNRLFNLIGRGGVDPQPYSFLSTDNILVPNEQKLIYIDADADSPTTSERGKIYVDNASVLNASGTGTVSTANATYDFYILNNGNAPYGWQRGYVQEVVIFNADKSGSRTQIQNNINTFYSIY